MWGIAMTCTHDLTGVPPISEPTVCATYLDLYNRMVTANDAAVAQGIEPGKYDSYRAAVRALQVHAETCGCMDDRFEAAFKDHPGRFVTVSVLEKEDKSWIFS
jgi:hypothetical protein